METLPEAIEDLIMNYVNQLNHYEKFKHVLEDIKENVDVEYHIPYWEAEAGYIVKTTTYKKEHYKRFRSVICHCCGRDIQLTMDEYSPEYETDDYSIDNHLHSVEKSIIKDMYKGRCKTFSDYNERKYLDLRSKICENQDDLTIGVIDDDGNRFEMLIDIGIDTDEDIEDIDTEDDDEMAIELTEEQVRELIEDFDEIDMFEEYEEILTDEESENTD